MASRTAAARAQWPAPGEAFMRAAIRAARRNVARGDGGPFGACVVRGREIVAVARNTVLRRCDPVCHAEVNAIRLAARRLGTHELAGCRIYTTTEPCPMCFGAIHWAGIGSIVAGTRIADVARLGFRELSLPNRTLRRLAGSGVEIVEGFLREECLALLRDWEREQGGNVY
jgi:tRNA(Arg) A34 adenosine deaminase TadA